MKMVSQLTRQALSRHRLISTAPPPASLPVPPPAQPDPTPAAHTLYASIPSPPSAPAPAAPPPPAPAPVEPPVRKQRTIYQQLMTSHDRMTERHIRHT